MKITYITQSYPPMISGASIVVERLAKGMAQRGHEIMVIAASDTGDEYTEMSHNLTVVRLPSIVNPKRVNQRFIPFSAKEVSSYLKTFSPDIIHIHDLLTFGATCLLLGKAMKIPIIATVHALPWFICEYLPEIPMLKSITETNLWVYSRWLNRNCQHMIVPTPTVAKTIEHHGRFKTIPISNGIELDKFSPYPTRTKEREHLIKKYSLDPNAPIILHIGRLDVEKKVDVILRSTAKILSKINGQFVIVGDGEYRSELEDLSNQLGISDRCHFLGFVDPKGDLPGLYRLGNVFTMASEVETQGLVILEAMASGLPVVAVRATSIHEIVKNKVNGYLIPPSDIHQYAQKVLDLLGNPGKATRMGKMSLKIAQIHDIRYSYNQHENLYQSTIKQFQQNEETGRSNPHQKILPNLNQFLKGIVNDTHDMHS